MEDGRGPDSICSYTKRKLAYTKPTQVSFTFYDLSKVFTSKTCYNKVKPRLGEGNLVEHYMEIVSFVSSFEFLDLDGKTIDRAFGEY